MSSRPNKPRPELRVEGNDDKHSVIHLLNRHGFQYEGDRKESDKWPEGLPTLEVADKSGDGGGVNKLLDSIGEAIQAATINKFTIGFVIDVDPVSDEPWDDDNLRRRWKGVRNRLKAAGLVNAPDQPSPGGTILDVPEGIRVGVWLMPDNQRTGALEDFLQSLIPADDPLIEHAAQATEAATEKSKAFQTALEQHSGPATRKKAILHAWLAWQEKPGLPYGVAIKSRLFESDSPAALSFVAWFKALYGVEPGPAAAGS